MPLPPDLIAGLGVTGSLRVSGGSIAESYRLETPSGPLFAKTRPDSAAMFAREAAGLRALRGAAPSGIGVPEVVRQTEGGLVLEWIATGRAEAVTGAATDADLGRGLAAIHRTTAADFGALGQHDPGNVDVVGYIGSVQIDLTPTTSWPEYYLERRLRPLAQAAVREGNLDGRFLRLLDRVAPRASELCGPAEQPTLVHGDLWGGNRLRGADGRNWLIDPAAHYAHREIDLAMMALFGGFGPAAFTAYDEAFALAPDWEDRVAWYQLPPLLVHAILFGGHYGDDCLRALGRYL